MQVLGSWISATCGNLTQSEKLHHRSQVFSDHSSPAGSHVFFEDFIYFYINFLAGQFFPRRPTCLYQKFHGISGTFQFFCWHRVFWFSRVVIPAGSEYHPRGRAAQKGLELWSHDGSNSTPWQKSMWQKQRSFKVSSSHTPVVRSYAKILLRHVDPFPSSQLISARWSSRVNGGVASIASSTNPIGPPANCQFNMCGILCGWFLFKDFCWINSNDCWI